MPEVLKVILQSRFGTGSRLGVPVISPIFEAFLSCRML